MRTSAGGRKAVAWGRAARACTRSANRSRGTRPSRLSPTLPHPRGEHERVRARPTGCHPPSLEVGRKRGKQADRAHRSSLCGLRLPGRVGATLNEEGALAHVAPAQRAQLAGTQTGVGEHRDEYGTFRVERSPDALDCGRAERSHLLAMLSARRTYERERIPRDRLGLSGVAQNGREERSALVDARRLHPRGDQSRLPLPKHADRDVPQRHMIEDRRNMEGMGVRIPDARGLLKRRRVLGRPSLDDPLGERRAAVGELLHGERSELLLALDLAVPCVGVGLAVEGAGAVAAVLAPADAVDALAALACDLLDAHRILSAMLRS